MAAIESLGEPGDWHLVGEGRAHAVFAYNKGALPHAERRLVRPIQQPALMVPLLACCAGPQYCDMPAHLQHCSRTLCSRQTRRALSCVK